MVAPVAMPTLSGVVANSNSNRLHIGSHIYMYAGLANNLNEGSLAQA